MSIENFNPRIELVSGVKPAGNRKFALMQACDILIDEHDKRLDTELGELRKLAEAERFPLPKEISTEAEMNSILANATESSIGAVYKFTGDKSDIYEKDALYVITHEAPDGDEVRY